MEIYKTIDDTVYEISNYGNVINTTTKHIMTPQIVGGYYNIIVDGKNYMIHRLVASTFIDNSDPDIKKWVDHIDNNKLNNHFTNLRWVSPHENGINKKLSIKNKSGYPGIYWNNWSKKYDAKIGYRYKVLKIGSYNTKLEAIQARQAKETELFGEFKSNIVYIHIESDLERDLKELEELEKNLI